jgi:hypothetical protein
LHCRLSVLHDNDHNRRGHAAGHGHKKAAKSSAKGPIDDDLRNLELK